METITQKLIALKNVFNASISSDFLELLLVSQNEIPVDELQAAILDDGKYKITKV